MESEDYHLAKYGRHCGMNGFEKQVQHVHAMTEFVLFKPSTKHQIIFYDTAIIIRRELATDWDFE